MQGAGQMGDAHQLARLAGLFDRAADAVAGGEVGADEPDVGAGAAQPVQYGGLGRGPAGQQHGGGRVPFGQPGGEGQSESTGAAGDQVDARTAGEHPGTLREFDVLPAGDQPRPGLHQDLGGPGLGQLGAQHGRGVRTRVADDAHRQVRMLPAQRAGEAGHGAVEFGVVGGAVVQVQPAGALPACGDPGRRRLPCQVEAVVQRVLQVGAAGRGLHQGERRGRVGQPCDQCGDGFARTAGDHLGRGRGGGEPGGGLAEEDHGARGRRGLHGGGLPDGDERVRRLGGPARGPATTGSPATTGDTVGAGGTVGARGAGAQREAVDPAHHPAALVGQRQVEHLHSGGRAHPDGVHQAAVGQRVQQLYLLHGEGQIGHRAPVLGTGRGGVHDPADDLERAVQQCGLEAVAGGVGAPGRGQFQSGQRLVGGVPHLLDRAQARPVVEPERPDPVVALLTGAHGVAAGPHGFHVQPGPRCRRGTEAQHAAGVPHRAAVRRVLVPGAVPGAVPVGGGDDLERDLRFVPGALLQPDPQPQSVRPRAHGAAPHQAADGVHSPPAGEFARQPGQLQVDDAGQHGLSPDLVVGEIEGVRQQVLLEGRAVRGGDLRVQQGRVQRCGTRRRRRGSRGGRPVPDALERICGQRHALSPFRAGQIGRAGFDPAAGTVEQGAGGGVRGCGRDGCRRPPAALAGAAPYQSGTLLAVGEGPQRPDQLRTVPGHGDGTLGHLLASGQQGVRDVEEPHVRGVGALQVRGERAGPAGQRTRGARRQREGQRCGGLGCRCVAPGRFLEDEMRVGAAHAERAEPGDPLPPGPPRPRCRCVEHPERPALQLQIRVALRVVQVAGEQFVPHGQHDLEQPGHARRGLQVADVRLDGADAAVRLGGQRCAAPPGELRERRAHARHLDGVAQFGARAVRLQVVHLGGADTGVGVGVHQQGALRLGVGCGQRRAEPAVVGRDPLEHGVHDVSAALGLGAVAQHDHADALAAHIAVGAAVEGLAAAVLAEHPAVGHRGVHLGRQQQVHPARDGQVAGAGPQRGGRLRDRGQRGGACRVDRHAGAAEVEEVGDPVGHQGLGHAGPRVSFEVPSAVPLELRVLHAGDADEHADLGSRERGGPQSGVLQRGPHRLQHQPLLRVHQFGLAR